MSNTMTGSESAAGNRKVKLEIKNMTKHYDNGDGVENINLKVYENEIVTFLGPSGCGKSTILRTIAGFLDVTSGDILVDGQSIVNLPPENRPTAMVFQSYNLWPHMTIYENLAFGLKLRKIPKKTIDEDIKNMLALVSMSGTEKKYPGQLSGGQQQRIAIARALSSQPDVIVLDEPTSALDISVQAQILNLLVTLQENHGLTYVLISHNVSVIRHMSDRVAVMYLGQIVELGDAQQVLTAPAHPYTRLLLDSLPAIDKPLEEEWALRKTDLPGNRTLPQGCFFYERCPLATHGCEVRQSLAIREDGRELRCWRAL